MILFFLSLYFCDLIFIRNHDNFERTLKIIISFTPLPHSSVCRILDSSSPCLTPQLANGNFKYVSMNKEASTGWYVKHLLSSCNCNQCDIFHHWGKGLEPMPTQPLLGLDPKDCLSNMEGKCSGEKCSINVASSYCVMGLAGY